jgi:hypothetical protein
MKIRLVILSLFVALSAACASAGSGSGSRSSATLTQSELAALGGGDALTAIRQLRPSWLRSGGQQTLSDPLAPTEGLQVYMGGLRLGPVSSLASLAIADIQRIEFLNAAQAQFRFGMGHLQGAIVVTPRAP